MTWRFSLLAWALWTTAAAAQAPRVDATGQPLPPDALARFGTSQFVHHGLAPGQRNGNWAVMRWRGNVVFADQRVSNNSAMRFSPDGKYFVTVGDQGVSVWDPASGGLLFRHRQAVVRDILFDSKSATIYFVGVGPNCWSWEPRKNQMRRLCDIEGLDVAAAAITADAKHIAMGSTDKLYLLDLDKADEPRVVWKSDEGFAGSMSFSPDGRYLALTNALTNQNRIRLLDAKKWKLARSYVLQNLVGMAFRPDSKGFAAVAHGGMRMFHTDFEEAWPEFVPAPDAALPPVAAADGKTLLGVRATDKGYLLTRWDIDTGKELSAVKIRDDFVCTAIDPTQKRIAIFDGMPRMLDFATCKDQLAIQPFPRMTGPAFTDRAGKTLGCVTEDNAVTFWDVGSAKMRHERRCVNPADKAIALSPRGRWITAQTDDEHGNFMLIEAESGNVLWQTDRTQAIGFPRFLAFSPDDRFLYETAGTGMQVWDPKTGKSRRHSYRNPVGGPLAFSPDGRLMLIELQLHEIATGEVRHRFTESFRALAFSPHAKHVALIKETGLEIDVLTVGTYQAQTQLSAGVELYSVAFSPDGRSLAAGDLDGNIHLWDVQGNYRHRFAGHSEPVTGLAFSEDGRRLASTSEDRTAIVWDLAKVPDRPKETPPPKDILLKMSWSWLAERTGTNAGKGMNILQSKPKETIAHFAAHIAPAKPVPADDVRRWLNGLASTDYAVRAQAMKSLEAADAQTEDVLRKTLTKETPAETKRRIEQLLERIEKYAENPQRLREVRAVEVLERIGSPEARALLTQWSEGPPLARLTREAKAALDRLQTTP
jgi:WD40 repeat protein